MKTEELLNLLNEWWKSGKVGSDRLKEYKRESFYELKKLFNYRQITILTGLRRVGKTTLMFQLIDDLLKEVEAKNILYYTYDEKKEDILTILNAFQKITGTDWKKEKVFIFLDEIQKLKDWSSKLKIIYDNFPKVKFVVSGSASVMLEKQAIDNLAGRYFLEDIPPLSIKEYFELKHKKRIENYELYKDELKIEVDDYLKKPFPEIVDWKEERRIFEYIKESVISKVLRIDLPEIFRNVNIALLETLIEIFFSNPGMILNLDSLSKSLRVHKKTLEQHIFFLKFSKLIRIVKNFRISILAESRKLAKVYPYDISLAFPFNPSVESSKILECVVASQTNAKNYWRFGNKEVDFILRDREILPIEIKAKEELEKNDFKNIKYLMKKFKVKSGIVIYLGETKRLENGIIAINFLDFLYKKFDNLKID
jgi:predicted AAA+ superfamily ATPase